MKRFFMEALKKKAAQMKYIHLCGLAEEETRFKLLLITPKYLE
jgi:hypothetical protein